MHKDAEVAATEQDSLVDEASDYSLKLVIRCWTATRELDIRFVNDDGPPFTSDEVRWQINGGPIRATRWRTSPNGNAVVVTEPTKRDVMKDLRNGKELTLYLSSNEERRYRMPLMGSTRAIGDVQKLCER
jgi:hypothetical protein